MVDVMLFICEDNIATRNKAIIDESGMGFLNNLYFLFN